MTSLSLKSLRLLFLFFIIQPLNIYSQQSGKLRGVVTDSTNGEVLPYANVFIKELNIGSSTDMRGFFLFASVPADQIYNLIVSYVGYKTIITKVKVVNEKMTHIEIKLLPIGIELQTVEKVERKISEEERINISFQKFSPRDLELMPKGVETDIFRSIRFLTGVQSTGDVSGRYYVRGGASNQNLVLLNDAPIYNPFHALGIFSVIDPEVINTVQFFKGGFGTEYNGRLSSVMNIITRDGNINRFSGSAALSQLSAKATVNGPIPFGSFILTGRKVYSNAILKKFLNNRSVPIDFYDASFKVNYANPEFAPISKFTIHGFTSSDIIDYENQLKPNYRWSNNLIGFNWFHAADSPLFSEITLYYSRFIGEEIPNLSKSRYKKNDLKDMTIKVDFNYTYDSKDELKGGLKISDVDTKLFIENANGYISDIGSKGSSISIYLNYMMQRISDLIVNVGTRLNLTRFATGGKYFLEPRFSFNYTLTQAIKLKGAWGIYQQDLITVSDEDEIISLFEPWIITPVYLKPASAIHYITGIDFNFTESLSTYIELYYKVYHNLSVLNDKKYYPGDNELVSGKGESYGFEFALKFNPEPITINVSYSLGWAVKDANGIKYPPRYDSRHNFSASVQCDLGSGWNVSAMWIYSSGMPFTKWAGYYDKLYLSDLFNYNQFFLSYDPYRLYADRNMSRLPDYHRLDLNVSKKLQIGFIKLDFDLSIINIYNRKNFFYFDEVTGERVNMLPFLPTANLRIEL